MRGLRLGLGLSSGTATTTIVSPASLSPAAWYDPSDISTLFQDSAGTTPVAADGDPVGKMLDKSGNGNHLVQAVTSAQPTYRTGGGLAWLSFNGTNGLNNVSPVGCATVVCAAYIDSTNNGLATGLVTNISDQDTDVDFAILAQMSASALFNSQGVGDGLADASHVWVNKVQTRTFATNTPQVYSADGSGHPASNLLFPSGLQLGSDRQIAGRGLIGRIYGVVTVGASAAQILSASNRRALETWLGTKAGLAI